MRGTEFARRAPAGGEPCWATRAAATASGGPTSWRCSERTTALRDRVLSALKLDESLQLIDHVHGTMSVSDVAGLAPIVVAIAEQGDRAARAIVRRTASELVAIADAAARNVLDDRPGGSIPTAFVGGLAGNPYFRAQILEQLSQISRICRWSEPVFTPAVGAVLLGADRVGILPVWGASALADLTFVDRDAR